jgi:hypothetical protein
VLTGTWKRCAGCRAVFACSNDHFERAWPAHRAACLVVQEREEAARRAGGLVRFVDVEASVRAWFAAQRAEAEAEAAEAAAEEAAAERARIEGLPDASLRRELSFRDVSPPADAGRAALLAARLAAPPLTRAQEEAALRRIIAERRWGRCRCCDALLPAGDAGACERCRAWRYCGEPCRADDLARHAEECDAAPGAAAFDAARREAAARARAALLWGRCKA